MTHSSELLEGLVAVAEEAGRIAQEARRDLGRELKPDGSIVTKGDRLTEEFLRTRLPELIPGTTVWGEEFGHAIEGAQGLWAVDPIDGTTNYAFGSPLWGVTIGLVREGSVRLGVIRLPDLNETYTAAQGQGAYLNGAALPRIPAGPICPYEVVGYTETVFKRYPGVQWPGKWRCSGSFVIEAMWVATQRYRGMVGVREKLYDLAASHVVCSELGAEIRYADGASFDIAALMRDVAVSKAWLIFPQGTGFRLDA